MTATKPPDPDPVAGPVATARYRLPVTAVLTVLGGFLTCVAVFLPWGIVHDDYDGTTVLTGFDVNADGILALALGLITVGFGLVAAWPAAAMTLVRRAPLALGALGGWLAIAEYNHLMWWVRYTQVWSQDNNWARGEVGVGVSVLLLAAAVTFVGGFSGARRRT